MMMFMKILESKEYQLTHAGHFKLFLHLMFAARII